MTVDVHGLLALCVHEWHERRARKLICFFDAAARPGATPRLSPSEPNIHDVAWLDPLELSPEDVSPFLHPLVEQHRLGWPDAPLSYCMVHRRNAAGLWSPAPL